MTTARSRLAAWEASAEGDESTEASGTGDTDFVELFGTGGATAIATVRVGPVVVELATLDAGSAHFIAVLAKALGGNACS